MWDYADFLTKARLYFGRGSAHDAADDEFTLWMLLGTEFLLRSPLAKVHPTLLAAPEGPSVLHAAGFRDPDWNVKSVPTHTVVDRLRVIVPQFTKERAEDALFLLNARNAELHTAESTFVNMRAESWLPRWIRVADAICDFLDEPLDSFVEKQLIAHARSLLDTADKKLAAEVTARIAACRAFVEKLSKPEVEERRRRFTLRSGETATLACPACASDVQVDLSSSRFTGERLEDDEVVYERVSVASRLECDVCGLLLDNTQEVLAAGLPLEHKVVISESLAERYESHYVDDDYGND